MPQIIQNTTKRPLVLARPMGQSPSMPKGVMEWEPVTLRPGVHEVDEATAGAMKNSATVQAWIKTGMLIVKPAKEKTTGLESFDDETAKSLVSDCFDVSLLDRWKASEKREEVRENIVQRVRDLEAEAK